MEDIKNDADVSHAGGHDKSEMNLNASQSLDNVIDDVTIKSTIDRRTKRHLLYKILGICVLMIALVFYLLINMIAFKTMSESKLLLMHRTARVLQRLRGRQTQ